MDDTERLTVVRRKLQQSVNRIRETRPRQAASLRERCELLDVLVADLNHDLTFLLDWMEAKGVPVK